MRASSARAGGRRGCHPLGMCVSASLHVLTPASGWKTAVGYPTFPTIPDPKKGARRDHFLFSVLARHLPVRVFERPTNWDIRKAFPEIWLFVSPVSRFTVNKSAQNYANLGRPIFPRLLRPPYGVASSSRSCLSRISRAAGFWTSTSNVSKFELQPAALRHRSP